MRTKIDRFFYKIFVNKIEKRPRVFLRIVLFLLISNTIIDLNNIIQLLLFSKNLESSNIAIDNRIFEALVNVVLLLHLAPFLDFREIKEYGLYFNKLSISDLGFGLFLGAFSMTSIFFLESSLGWISINNFLEIDKTSSYQLKMLIREMLAWIAVALSEEIVFRGYILRNLCEGFNFPNVGAKKSVFLAVIISSLLFTFVHFSNPNISLVGKLNIFLVGLFLGFSYILTGNLGLSIGFHFSWNFFQGEVFGFPVSGTTKLNAVSLIRNQNTGIKEWTGGIFGPEGGIFCALLTILSGLLLIVWFLKFHRGVAPYELFANYRPRVQSDTSESS